MTVNNQKQLFDKLLYIETAPTENDFIEIIKHKHDFLPLLLNELRLFSQIPDIIDAFGDKYIRHIVSIFLLAHLRSQDAYVPIIHLLSNHDKKMMQLTGEVVSESLGRILASVYDGDIQPIKDIIENERLDPWVRAGALDSLMVLWKEDELSRNEVISYLAELLGGRLERRASYVWDAVALIAHDIHPLGLETLLKQAISDKLIEPIVMDEDVLERCLAEPFDSIYKSKTQLVDGYMKSPFEELSWWLYPDRKTIQKGQDYASLDVPIVDKEVVPGERVSPMGWRSATVVNQHKKVGRNSPCICGSGKKYKKCCLLN